MKPKPELELDVRPLTAELWPSLEDLLGPLGACNGCWCMYWRIGAAYRKKTAIEEQSRFSGRGEEGAITRTVGIRGRFSRWLVPAYSEGSTAAHRARVEAKACG